MTSVAEKTTSDAKSEIKHIESLLAKHEVLEKKAALAISRTNDAFEARRTRLSSNEQQVEGAPEVDTVAQAEELQGVVVNRLCDVKEAIFGAPTSSVPAFQVKLQAISKIGYERELPADYFYSFLRESTLLVRSNERHF